MSNPTALQKKIKKDMRRCPVFLYKISHSNRKEQLSRLHIANQFQRRTLLRVLRQFALGKIPMTNDTYIEIKSKKKASALQRLDDVISFKKLIQGSKIIQTAEIKKFLPILKSLFHVIFYKL